MTAPADEVLDALRQSLREAERLRQRNRELASAAWAPVAIVGMGCRFPGAAGDPQGLWGVAAAGADVISRFPVDRGWDGGDGGSYARAGGFVDGVAGFDAGFFGIS